MSSGVAVPLVAGGMLMFDIRNLDEFLEPELEVRNCKPSGRGATRFRVSWPTLKGQSEDMGPGCVTSNDEGWVLDL
jgi:hypothetical protein